MRTRSENTGLGDGSGLRGSGRSGAGRPFASTRSGRLGSDETYRILGSGTGGASTTGDVLSAEAWVGSCRYSAGSAASTGADGPTFAGADRSGGACGIEGLGGPVSAVGMLSTAFQM